MGNEATNANTADEGNVELVNTNGNGVPNSVAPSGNNEGVADEVEEVNENGNGVPDAPVCKTDWDTTLPIKQQFKDLLSFRGCFANPRVA